MKIVATDYANAKQPALSGEYNALTIDEFVWVLVVVVSVLARHIKSMPIDLCVYRMLASMLVCKFRSIACDVRWLHAKCLIHLY